MAYKFNIGTFKFGGTLDIAAASGDIELPNNSVDNSDLAGQISPQKMKADTANSFSKLILTHSGGGGDNLSADDEGLTTIIANNKICRILVSSGNVKEVEFTALNKAAGLLKYDDNPANGETLVFIYLDIIFQSFGNRSGVLFSTELNQGLGATTSLFG